MQIRAYQQCVRCVMDTTDLQITFDPDGRCCHCTEYIEQREKPVYHGRSSDEAFERIVQLIKSTSKSKTYNCVLGVSGGADSSYVAYLAKQKGLRPLAVHLDNGWDSDKAVSNIRSVTATMGVDYESYVLDWEEFKDVQLAFLKASVPEAETPTDMAIPAALHAVAAKYDVRFILSGGNMATEGILPRSWHYNARDMKYFSYIHRTFGTRKLRKFPTFGYKAEMYYKLAKGIRTIYPLDLVPYSKAAAIDLLVRDLAWRPYGGKHHESRYTKFIQSYYLFEKFHIDYRRATFSAQICAGDITREEALDELKTKPYDLAEVEQEKLYIAKKLGVSNEVLEEIIRLPAKWYWDYPNDERKLRFIYDTYRSIFKKPG